MTKYIIFQDILIKKSNYISNLLSIKCKPSYNLRSNSGILLKPPSGKMLVTVGGRAFQAAAPHLWNELPSQLRTIQSVDVFKKSIKSFLFKQFSLISNKMYECYIAI